MQQPNESKTSVYIAALHYNREKKAEELYYAMLYARKHYPKLYRNLHKIIDLNLIINL